MGDFSWQEWRVWEGLFEIFRCRLAVGDDKAVMHQGGQVARRHLPELFGRTIAPCRGAFLPFQPFGPQNDAQFDAIMAHGDRIKRKHTLIPNAL